MKTLDIILLRKVLALYQVDAGKLIRIGNNFDGGYVLPDIIAKETEVLYNYGVGNEISFEEQFLDLFPDTIVRAFDHTILKFPATTKPIHYYKEGLSSVKTKNHDSFFHHQERFGDEKKKTLLKIDIEGGEYDFFNKLDYEKLRANVIGIVMEIHLLDQNRGKFIQIIDKISRYFNCVHIHPNNYGEVFLLDGYLIPDSLELTFVNKSLYNLTPLGENYTLPLHGLDCPNLTEVHDCTFDLYNLDNNLKNNVQFLVNKVDTLNAKINYIYTSTSWKITQPLRNLKNYFVCRKLFP